MSHASESLAHRDYRHERVLVTGATGFIGGNLAAGLLDAGADVFVIERDRKAHSTLRALGIEDRVSIVSGDICDLALMERVFAEHEITYAFHLAAQAIVGTANSNPISTFEANIAGTWCTLEGARRCKTLKGIVVASSDKAYGVHEKLPYDESYALNGRYPYDASKACADIIAQSYSLTYGLPLAITRNANTYGPGDLNWSRLVPDAVRCAVEGRPFTIRSDGLMKRDYMFVGDAVDGYLLLAKSLDRPDVRGHAFNFGTGEPRTVLEVASLVREIAGGPEPVVLNQAKYEIPNQWLDISKASSEWGWSARVSLRQGLEETVRWYRAYLARVAALAAVKKSPGRIS